LGVIVNREDLFAAVQAGISLIVVLGGGLTLVFRSELSDTVVPLITLVLGFYFGSGSVQRGFAMGQASQLGNK
jgi:hypothetical protein